MQGIQSNEQNLHPPQKPQGIVCKGKAGAGGLKNKGMTMQGALQLKELVMHGASLSPSDK